jgi:hypothetical protein
MASVFKSRTHMRSEAMCQVELMMRPSGDGFLGGALFLCDSAEKCIAVFVPYIALC